MASLMSDTDALLGEDFGTSINSRKHYWQYLVIVGVFLFLPVAQFAIFQESYDDVICYYNKKCEHKVAGIDAFNNVISNVPYLIFGSLFILTVRFSKKPAPGCGIHRDDSLHYAMGICLILIGLFSGLYHVCPSPLNFQFDTVFMFISGAITFLALYHKRHKEKIPTPFKTYLFLALIYYISTISLIKYKSGVGLWLWILTDFIIIYVLLHGTANLYYATDFTSPVDLFNKIKDTFRNWNFVNKPKLALVAILNLFTITMLIYATFISATVFTDWFLALFVINMTIYFVYYTIQKVIHNETVMWYIWVLIIIDVATLGTALIFFTHAVSNKFLTHAESDALNEPCALFGYFDYHDIWHFLSAIGLYIFLNIIYFIDDDLRNEPRSSITVF